MPWSALAGPLVYAIALLMLPGLVVALAAGRRGFAAVALAPALSVTTISVGGILGGFLGVPWGWWTPAALALLLAAAAWGAHRLLRGHNPRQDAGAGWRQEWPLWVGAAAGIVAWLRCLREIYVSPDTFSQLFDNIFHLSLVRYMAEAGTGSSFSVTAMDPGAASSFYPAAFHGYASLVFMVFPDSITVAMNAAIWTMLAVAWPLGCLYLAVTVTRSTGASLIGVGILSASFPGFPFLLLQWGILYPNILGLILLPVAIALSLEALGLGRSSRYDAQALVLGALVLPGLALSHPSTLLSLMAVVAAPILARAFREWKTLRDPQTPRRASIVRLSLLLACLPVFAAVWLILRPGDAPWDPPLSRFEAVGQALLNAPFGPGPAWAVSALMLLGIVSAWRHGSRWLVTSWIVVAVMWVVVSSGPANRWRELLTGGYYNDPYRVGALLAVVSLAVSALGLASCCTWLASQAARLPRGSASLWEAVVGVLVAAALTVATQPSTYMAQTLGRVAGSHALSEGSWILTTDELALIHRIPQEVPPSAIIATNPWNGSSLVYAFTGIQTTTKHVFYTPTRDLDILQFSLDEATTNPIVCPAIRDMGVDYVLDFGDQEITPQADHPFPGFDSLDTAPGFELVDREGSVALYRITACR